MPWKKFVLPIGQNFIITKYLISKNKKIFNSSTMILTYSLIFYIFNWIKNLSTRIEFNFKWNSLLHNKEQSSYSYVINLL